jgi:uncharacterized protein YcbX
VTRVRVGATGFEWDRHWMVVKPNGMFLTQRTHPRLARIVPELTADSLLLHAPQQDTLRVPLIPEGEHIPIKVFDFSGVALDQGSAVAEWVSHALGESVRLVRVAPSMPRASKPKYSGTTRAPIAFADGYPILVCNEASLADINQHLPEAVPMERFRPNLVLRGLPAFAEDRIESLQIGGVTLRLVKPCTRCTIPSIDQRTGEPATDPTPVLKKYRFNRELLGVTFGENAVIAAGVGAWIERDAECQVTYRPAAAWSTTRNC